MAPCRIPQNLDNTEVMSTQSTAVDFHLHTLFSTSLNLDRSNFMEWLNDAKAVLSAEDLANTLNAKEVVDLSHACKWQALLIMRHHLDPSLRLQYIQVHDPANFGSQLHARFHHQ